MHSGTKPYWLEVPAITGHKTKVPEKGSVVVIGSGFTGASVGYFLNQHGFENVIMIDDEPQKAATFRNAGHILYGTVESMKALSEIHGAETAKEIWSYSIELCEKVARSIRDLKIDCDYRQDGYLVISVSPAEDKECQESVHLLNSMGFQSEYYKPEFVRGLGFKNVEGARYEAGSAQGHPGKFRNGMVQAFLNTGGKYHSGLRVRAVYEAGGEVMVETNRGVIKAEAAVIATNAYSPLVSEFFKSRGLIEPFRGNIITSKPLRRHQFKVKYPHSFDHGYEYALITEDNRLLVGGWRNHSSTKEMGTHDLGINEFIENGLKGFVEEVYDLQEPIEWEYSWAGIMASTKTGFPFVGATNSERIYCCAGYNGHGFSWGHGCASLLADIIAGASVPEVARYFNPKKIF